MYVDPIQHGWLQSNIHFNWIRLISALMNSWIPLPFPYFRSQRGLNLSAGICAGVGDDDQTHLKENNTLTPKHLMPAWGWMSFQSSSSAFGVASLFLFLHRMKKEANYPKIGCLTMYNCTQYNRQRVEPKVSPGRMIVTQPSVATSSMLKLIVEVAHFCGGHDACERYKSWVRVREAVIRPEKHTYIIKLQVWYFTQLEDFRIFCSHGWSFILYY